MQADYTRIRQGKRPLAVAVTFLIFLSLDESHWKCREVHPPRVGEGPLFSRYREIVHKARRREPEVCD